MSEQQFDDDLERKPDDEDNRSDNDEPKEDEPKQGEPWAKTSSGDADKI